MEVVAGTTYEYYVIPTNSCGAGLQTSTVTATAVTTPSPSFSLSANPSYLQGSAGGGDVPSTLSLSASGGFTGPVSLSAAVTDINNNPVTGVTVSFANNTENLSSTTVTDAMTITASSGLADGDYTITVTGTSGGLTETTTLEFYVQASFALNANPDMLTVPVGAPAQTSTIVLTPIDGFSGIVNLSTPTVTLNGAASASVTATLSATSIDASSSTPTSILSVAAAAGAAPGDYIIYFTGTDSGGNQTSCSVQATVQSGSFNVSAQESYLEASAGSASPDTITVQPVGSFTGPVTVTVTSITDPNGNPVANVSTWAAFASSGGISTTGIVVPGNENDTLNLSAPATAIEGDYTINLTGTDSSGNTAATSIDLYVNAGFTLNVNPGALTIQPATSAVIDIQAGGVGSETGSIALTAAATDEYGNTTSAITASAASPSSTPIGGMTPSAVTVSAPTGATPGNYMVTITGTDASGNIQTATVPVTVQTGGFTISPAKQLLAIHAGAASATDLVTVSPIGSFLGLVNLSVTSVVSDPNNTPTSAVTATMESPSVNLPTSTTDQLAVTVATDAPQGSYAVNLSGTDSNGNTATATVYVNVTGGFTLNATPGSLAIPPGSSVTSVVTAIADGSETGNVSLTSQIFDNSGDPVTDGSVTCALSPSTLGIGNGTTSSAAISVGSQVRSGNKYTVVVSGADAGGDKSLARIAITVGTPSFTVTDSPAAVSVNAGDALGSTSEIVVTPTSAFSDPVVLTGSVAGVTGITLSFAPPAVEVEGHGATSVVTVTALAAVTPGTYTATITGTLAGVTADTTLQITVNASGSPVLTIGNASWAPNPADVGAAINGTVGASIAPSPLQTDSVAYSWNAGQVWRADPESRMLKFAPYNGNYKIIWPANTSSTQPFNPTFYEPGDYIIQVSATAKITHGDGSITVISGFGYIGGSQSDVAGIEQAEEHPDAVIADETGTVSARMTVGAANAGIVILMNGANITGKTTFIPRGVQIHLLANMTSDQTLAVKRWVLSNMGSPAKGFGWTHPIAGVKLDCAVQVTKLTADDKANANISFTFTKGGSHIRIQFVGYDSFANEYAAATFFTIKDPTDYYHDANVTVKPLSPSSSSPSFVMSIPPAQIQFPFTLPTNVLSTCEGAAVGGKFTYISAASPVGLPITIPYTNYFYWKDYFPTGSIGDWGKKPSLYYPDLYYDGAINARGRRMGANFCLGAAVAAAGGTELIALASGEMAPLENRHLHPSAEQSAIAAGWNWWAVHSSMPLNNGAVVAINY